mgnify:CR=1 FL=1
MKQAKLARKAGLLVKYSVNENGRITVVKDKAPHGQKFKWQVVRNMEELEVIVGRKLPFEENYSTQRSQGSQSQSR